MRQNLLSGRCGCHLYHFCLEEGNRQLLESEVVLFREFDLDLFDLFAGNHQVNLADWTIP